MHLCSEDYETRTKPNAPGVIPESDRRIPLSITKLESLINGIPIIEVDETKPCEKCEGRGTIIRYQGIFHDDFDCPDCDGSGEVETGSKVSQKSSEYCIKIGDNHWNLFILEKLIWAADQLEVETVFLKNQSTPIKPDLYEVGDIEIMIMPRLEASEKILTYHI